MTTQQIADRLIELCNKGDFETAQKELYADDAVSIEPQARPGMEKETKGLEAIIQKGKIFMSMVQEVHSSEISAPIVAPNSFAIRFNLDITMKERGRMPMSELCIYDIKDGKIISESFHM